MIFLIILEIALYLLFAWISYKLLSWALSPLFKKEGTAEKKTKTSEDRDKELEEELNKGLWLWRLRRDLPRDE